MCFFLLTGEHDLQAGSSLQRHSISFIIGRRGTFYLHQEIAASAIWMLHGYCTILLIFRSFGQSTNHFTLPPMCPEDCLSLCTISRKTRNKRKQLTQLCSQVINLYSSEAMKATQVGIHIRVSMKPYQYQLDGAGFVVGLLPMDESP